jgi:predicted amidophosphoribosyltransferase
MFFIRRDEPARCPHCGQRATPYAAACPLCGAHLAPETRQPPARPFERAAARWRRLRGARRH